MPSFYVTSTGKPILLGGSIMRAATVDDPDPATAKGAFEVVKVDEGDEFNDGWYLRTTSPLPALPSGAGEWVVKFRIQFPGPTSDESIIRGETIADAGDDVDIRIADPTSARIQVLLVPVGATAGGKRRFGRPQFHRVSIPIVDEPPSTTVAPPGLTAAQVTDYLSLVDDPYNEGYFTVQLTLPVGHLAYEAVRMHWAKYGPALTEIDDPYPQNFPMVRLADSGSDRVWRFDERWPGDTNKKHARLPGGNFQHLAIQYQVEVNSTNPSVSAGLISPVIEWFSVTVPADTSEAPVISTTGTVISPASPIETDTLTVVRQASGNPDPIGAGSWTYQWKKGGVDISGATSHTLPPSEFSATDSITCAVGVTTSSGSDSFTTPAVVIAAAPTIQPPALDAGDWEIVEVVEHPSKAGYYTAHVRLLLAGPPSEYAVFWSDWTSSVQPKPGFPCDFVETDGDGRKVWRLGDHAGNDNKWNTVLPSVSKGNIRLRYQLIAHGANPQADYVSDNSTDSKAFTAPDVEEPPVSTGTFGLMPVSVINEAANKPLTWRIANPGANNTFIGLTPVAMAMSAYAGHTGVDDRLIAQINTSVAGNTCPAMHGGFEQQYDSYWCAMAVIAKSTSRIWSDLSSTTKTKMDLLMHAGLIAAAFGSSDVNPYGNTGKSGSIINAQQWPRAAPNFSASGPMNVVCAVLWFGKNDVISKLQNYNHTTMRTSLQSAGLTNTVDAFTVKSGRPSASQIANAIDGTWKHRGLGIADYFEIWRTGVNRIYNRKVMSGYGGTAANGWIGPGYNGRAKIISGASGLPHKGQTGMLNEFDAKDGYPGGVRSSMSYCQWGARLGIAWTCAMAVAGELNLASSNVNETLGRMDIGMIDVEYKHVSGYLSWAKNGTGQSETWTKAERNTSWGINFNHGLWFDVLKPWWQAG